MGVCCFNPHVLKQQLQQPLRLLRPHRPQCRADSPCKEIIPRACELVSEVERLGALGPHESAHDLDADLLITDVNEHVQSAVETTERNVGIVLVVQSMADLPEDNGDVCM